MNLALSWVLGVDLVLAWTLGVDLVWAWALGVAVVRDVNSRAMDLGVDSHDVDLGMGSCGED